MIRGTNGAQRESQIIEIAPDATTPTSYQPAHNTTRRPTTTISGTINFEADLGLTLCVALLRSTLPPVTTYHGFKYEDIEGIIEIAAVLQSFTRTVGRLRGATTPRRSGNMGREVHRLVNQLARICERFRYHFSARHNAT